MNWVQDVDSYCERLGPTFWAEPVNAITNLAFIIAAVLVWPRIKGRWEGRVLAFLIAAIGLASGTHHTVAQVWSGAADSLSILVFILFYLYLASRDMLGLGRWASLGMVLAFFPYAAVAVPVFSMLPFLGSSAAYAPVALLIAVYALLVRNRNRTTARRMGYGAALLTISILARSFDEPLCANIPLGTHFLWHVLNGILLGYMALIWHAHVLAGRGRAL